MLFFFLLLCISLQHLLSRGFADTYLDKRRRRDQNSTNDNGEKSQQYDSCACVLKLYVLECELVAAASKLAKLLLRAVVSGVQ